MDLLEDSATDNRRALAAARVKAADDVKLPRLAYWNYRACRKHDVANQCEVCSTEYWHWCPEHAPLVRGEMDHPKKPCRDCGLRFRKHQRVGVAWLYMVQKGLLADTVGSGKTAHAGGLLAMLKQYDDQLSHDARCLMVARAPALLQHQRELQRMLPLVQVATAMGTRQQRIDRYLQPWEVMLMGQQMLLRDVETMLHFQINTLIVDDVDALRNPENRTSWALKRIARDCDRVIIMTGTPLQKRLHELHSVLEPLGGRDIFGSAKSFTQRYVRTEKMRIWNTKTGRRQDVTKVVGYKNTEEFKRLIEPLALRRTAADIDDVDLPEVIPNNVELELYPRQREKYNELKRGVITLLREEGATVKQATAMGKIHYGAQICAGLATLGEPDGPETSCKLDWLMDKVSEGGDLEDEKVVCFIGYKATIRALHVRLDAAGIGYETVWGDEPDKAKRQASQDRFWDDPDCKLLLGTQAIEQSLNLQVSRHLVNVDMILNPARMEQLAGRIRRDGSAFRHVYVHNLLCQDTQEERYLPLLEREQALIDHIWDESSELFEALNPVALLQLIAS